MSIEGDIRDLLVSPLLRQDLGVIVDDFRFEEAEEPNPFRATIFCLPTDDKLRLELRFPAGCDLSSIFPQKDTVTVGDFRAATGSVNGKVLIRIAEIQPPHNVESGHSGDVSYCVATLDFGKVEILRNSLVRPDVHLDSIPEANSTEDQDDDFSPLDEIEEEGCEDFSHIVIFANTKVPFRNTSITHADEHPFWGRNSSSKSISWDGEVFGGSFSMMQEGDDLKVGFRHRSANREEASRKAEALFAGIGYTLGVDAWQSYFQLRRGGRVVTEHLRFARPVQGKYVPLRKRHGRGPEGAPTKLISSVAHWLLGLSDKERNHVDHLLWVFRGADNRNVPTPAKLAMIGGVVEGLFSTCKIPAPAAFLSFQEEAITWAGGIAAESSGTESADKERAGFADRLAGYLKDWGYNNRRTAWKEAFGPLFPESEVWLNEIFNLYQKHRNPPAHGNFADTMKGDHGDLIDAIGRLAGFVNLVIAAKAGYKGPILESPFADRVVQLR
jgi:hypothetical protein